MMRWSWEVGGRVETAVWDDGLFVSSSFGLEILADALVASQEIVECGLLGPSRVAGFGDEVVAWGTISEALAQYCNALGFVEFIEWAECPVIPEEENDDDNSFMSKVARALAKASFGGDRSAAGRYAAEQRWKGHVKSDIDRALELQLPPLPVPTTEAGKDAQRIYSDQSFDDATGMSPSGQWMTTVQNVRRDFPYDAGIVDGSAYGTPAEDVLNPENLAKADAFIKEKPMYSYSIKYADAEGKKVPYLEVWLQIIDLKRITHQRVDPSLPHAYEDTKQFLYERPSSSWRDDWMIEPIEQFDEEELIKDTSPKNPSGIPPAALYRWERASSKKNPGVSEMPWCDSIGWHASEIAGLPEPYPKPDQSYRVYFQTPDSTLRLHAQDLLKAVSNAPAQQPTLWRGVGGSHQGQKATGNPDQLNVGDTFDLSLASTSRDVRQAAKYGSTWFRIEAGSKGIKIPSKQSAYAHDQEVITSGKFRVTSKETVTVRDSTDFYKAKKVLRDARTLLQGDPRYDQKIAHLVQRVVNLSNNTGSTREVIGVVQEGTFPL